MKMMEGKNVLEALTALDRWFVSQEIEVSDRAVICSAYLALFISKSAETRAHFENGIELAKEAVEDMARKHLEGSGRVL